MNDLYNYENNFKAISDALKNFSDFSIEIIWSAMHYIKRKPTSSIEEAINYGIKEWIK